MKNFFLLIIILFFNSKSFAGAETAVLGSVATGAATGAVQSAATGKALEVAAANSPAVKSMTQKIGAFLESPTGVAVVSGIGMANSLILRQAAQDQAEEAEHNIKKIETLMTTFQDSWVAFCPKGRNDLNEPSCYCYLEGGKKDPNKSNSQTCKNFWANQDFKLSATADSYRDSIENSDPVGCITTAGSFDEGCKCKKFIDSKGNNACKKSTSLKIPENSIGSAYVNASGVPRLFDTINQLTQGNIGVGNLNGKALAIAFKKQADMNSKIFDQLGLKSQGKINTNPVTAQKYQDQLFPKKSLEAYNSATGNKSNFDFNSSASGPMKNAIKAVTKRTGLDITDSGKGLPKKADEKGANFNFSDGSASNGSANVEYNEPQKVYKVKGDISNDSGASIFQIISNRYLESGIQKLFDEDVK